ncbi:MAG TPA: efflux RND transporter periplasmic adaptor subunit [Cyclobacteriaceae bacterium]
MRNNIKYWHLIMIIPVLAACNRKEVINNKRETINVKVSEVRLEKKPVYLKYSGSVESYDQSLLSTKVMGQIKSLDYEEGDRVRKNEIIVRIESSDLIAKRSQLDANLDQAKANLQNTSTNYERIKNLYEKKSATQKELDDITTALTSAKAQVSSLESAIEEIKVLLSYTLLKAPFDGYITKKFVHEGSMANPGQPIVAIESTDRLKVVAKVPESEVVYFKNGQVLDVVFKAINAEMKGTVRNINPSSNFSGNQYAVNIAIEESNLQLKPGMFAEVNLVTYENQQISLPRQALVKKGQLDGVYTVNPDNKAMLRWIRTGKSNGEQVEILSGLDIGERYITYSEGRIENGQQVAITNE